MAIVNREDVARSDHVTTHRLTGERSATVSGTGENNRKLKKDTRMVHSFGMSSGYFLLAVIGGRGIRRVRMESYSRNTTFPKIIICGSVYTKNVQIGI